uniref:Uncharacterized protein n=1 Tax=Ustilago esculenta TaxID=185366 RepID=A0A481SFL9_9BASI|nr:hypothetical protein UE_1439 [Ustilago esculenta]
MQSYFKDEVHISLLSSDEHHQLASDPQPRLSFQAESNDNTSPLLSSRSSLSSATIFDYADPPHSHFDAFARDRQRWSATSESSETLVGTLFSNRFPSLKNKFPSVLGNQGYKALATDEFRHTSRRVASRKKAICLLLLAALFLGVGGRQLHKAILQSYRSSAADSFRTSLRDEDSLQDASITVPTLPRPLLPLRPEEVLPFYLHHSDTVISSTPAPAPSALNRRQLDSLPTQRHLFDKQECVEAWISDGTVCDTLESIFRKRPELTNVDIVYTWVNGSDWRHSSAKWMHGYRPTGHWQDYVEEDLFPSSSTSDSSKQPSSAPARRRLLPEAQHEGHLKLTRRSGAAIQSRFRDHEELRYSMRSAAKHLHGLSTIHIVAPDFSAPYHIQPGAHKPVQPGKMRSMWNKITAPLRRRGASQPPFVLNVNRLKEGFVGLPSQLRRVQGLGTDRFTTDEGQIREGQVPQWLSVLNSSHVLAGQEASTAGATWSSTSFPESLSKLFSSASSPISGEAPPKVRLHHDWNAFTDNWLVTEPLTAEERKRRDDYRRAGLPTFNSMAIESMLGDQPGLNDNFIYSNDDFFFMDDASTGDITSPFYGPVLRLDYNLVVKGKRSPDTTPGEWSSLWHTNWLLDQRFGQRSRPYIQHVHKSFSKSLLHETRMGWAHEHARIGLNRFRNGGDNLVTHFLTYYNMVERHREALLWSFFMLRLDRDGDGVVSSEQELPSALMQMGLTKDQIATMEAATTQSNATQPRHVFSVIVKLAKRTTLAQDSANAALVKAGWPVPLKSRYAFTSQDGYPLGDISDQVIYRRNEPRMERRTAMFAPGPDFGSTIRGVNGYFGWPDFVDDASLHPNNEWYNRRFDRPACELDLDRCLVRPFGEVLQRGKLGWEEVFKRFAYADVGCGDCLIQHLVGQSGERGLSAFLPPAERVYQGATEERARYSNPVPHLPLTSVWDADSLQVDAAFEPEKPCFTVACVLANSGYGTNTPLRQFASKLIQRYAYTIAESPLRFNQLETQYNSLKAMTSLQESMLRPSALETFQQEQAGDAGAEAGAWLSSQRKVDSDRPVFACINDDITDRWVEFVGNEFTQWMGKMWPEKQAWEL